MWKREGGDDCEKADDLMKTSNTGARPKVARESSKFHNEAIQSRGAALDCFASLAMTAG